MSLRKLIACSVAGGLALSGWAMSQSGADVLSKLRLTRPVAAEAVLDGLVSGSPYSGAAFAAFKTLDSAGRTAVVEAGLAAIKAFTETDEFKAAYAGRRDELKPSPSEAVPAVDEFLKKRRQEMETQIAAMRKAMEGFDEAARKSMEQTIKQSLAQLEAMEKDPSQKAALQAMFDQQREQNRLRDKAALADWEARLPADPRALIAARIREFLKASADVDFSARLVRDGDAMKFEDKAYEARPGTWKLCFRAGRDAVAAARSFAQGWLTELER